MWRSGLVWVGLLWAQSPLPYKELHQRLYPLVRDTSKREWLPRLRQEMEALRHVEWNDRFFREIVALYLNQSDTISVLLGTVRRYVKVDSARLAQLFLPVADRDADASALNNAYSQFLREAEKDTSQTGYLLRQGSLLARSAVEAWVMTSEKPPLSLMVEAALRGYLRALTAGYAFFGFDESPEPWRDKMKLLEAIGILEYYAYGESANAFRAWRKGFLR